MNNHWWWQCWSSWWWRQWLQWRRCWWQWHNNPGANKMRYHSPVGPEVTTNKAELWARVGLRWRSNIFISSSSSSTSASASASASTINIRISANQDQLVLQNTGFPTTHSPLVQTRHWRFLIIMINVVIIIIIINDTDHHPFIYLKLNLERAWQPHWGPVEHITPPLSTFGHNFIIFPSSSLPTSTPTSTSSSSSTKCSPNHDDDREVRLTDLGVYVCKAANKIDEQEAAVFLHGDYI